MQTGTTIRYRIILGIYYETLCSPTDSKWCPYITHNKRKEQLALPLRGIHPEATTQTKKRALQVHRYVAIIHYRKNSEDNKTFTEPSLLRALRGHSVPSRLMCNSHPTPPVPEFIPLKNSTKV